MQGLAFWIVHVKAHSCVWEADFLMSPQISSVEIVVQKVPEWPRWYWMYPQENPLCKIPPLLCLWASVWDTNKSQRETKLDSIIICLLPQRSVWCRILILIGLFSCQMEDGDSNPRCACLIWMLDYLVGVSSWPVIKGTLMHVTSQLLIPSSARRRSTLKQFPASKPMFAIFSLRAVVSRTSSWACQVEGGWQKVSHGWGW